MLAILPDDGEGLAPVTLSAEEPVAQLEVRGAFAEAFFLEPDGDFFLGFRSGQAVEEAGVDGNAVIGVALPLFARRWLHDLFHRKVKLGGKLEVTGVMRRHGHDGSGAVTHHDVIRDPDRDLLVVHGINGVSAGEDAGFFFGQFRAL